MTRKAPAENLVITNVGKKRNDCIYCAIVNALPLSYEQGAELLARTACGVKGEMNTVRNIRKALVGLGAVFAPVKERVQFAKFAADHNGSSNYIIIACDHAAAVVKGKLLDEWNSSRKFVKYVVEITAELYSKLAQQYGKEEETMKNTNTTTQTTETTAAIIPEVLPPEETCAALVPAALQEQKQSNVPGAPLDADERTYQLLKAQATLAATLPGVKSLQLVGRWLWLEFTGKPTAEIRQQLKDNKWSWAPKKGKWTYHNPEEPRPGKHRYMTFEEIQNKHGAAALI